MTAEVAHNAGSQIRRALEMLKGIEGSIPWRVEVEIQTAEMALRRARAILSPEPACTGLVATREDDDVVSWDRPKGGLKP